MLPATGKNVTDTRLISGTITIDPSNTPGSKEGLANTLHEFGHADKAASDPVGYVRDGADDKETGPDGKPLPHDDRPNEKDADAYRDKALKWKH